MSFLNNHHAFPQNFGNDPAIKSMGVDIDAAFNRMYLPVDRAVAAEMGLTPHPGGPFQSYQGGMRDFLDRMGPGGNLDEFNAFVETARYALSKGDLYTNLPLGQTREGVRQINDDFFANWKQYRIDNAEGIQALNGRVQQLIDAEQPGAARFAPLLSQPDRLQRLVEAQLDGRLSPIESADLDAYRRFFGLTNRFEAVEPEHLQHPGSRNSPVVDPAGLYHAALRPDRPQHPGPWSQ